MRRHLFGFGGVRLQNANMTLTFPHAPGQLIFEPEKISNVTARGKIIEQYQGWRPIISVTLYNTCDGEFDNFRRLPDIISDLSRGVPLIVYPQFNPNDGNLGYEVALMGGFNLENIAASKVGQRITLDFQGIYVVNEIPSLASDPEWAYLVTQAGDYLVTQSGDRILIPI